METRIATLVETPGDSRVAAIYAEAHHLLSLLKPAQIEEALPTLRELASEGGILPYATPCPRVVSDRPAG